MQRMRGLSHLSSLAACCYMLASAAVLAACLAWAWEPNAPTALKDKIRTATSSLGKNSGSTIVGSDTGGLSGRGLEVRFAGGLSGEDADQRVVIQLCQCNTPMLCGVECGCQFGGGEDRWSATQPIPWEVFAQGEYVGPARVAHVPTYRLRVDDQLDFIFRFTHEESREPYRLGVGDEIIIESLTDTSLNRGALNLGQGLVIQPDGTITLPLLGGVPVARRTVEEVRKYVEDRYLEYYKDPAITVTPLKTNTRLEDLRATVDGRFGQGGQRLELRITPEGSVQLPAIGSVLAQGLTLTELEREIEERYLQEIGAGVEVTPTLAQRAPRFIYVVGEVAQPGQFTLQQPTTIMGAIALAGGWNNGGNLREIVVFRRTEDWRLMATRIDIRGALLGKRPCPADEIWLRDSDIVVVPKSPILLMDDFINLVFTRGIYGVLPVGVAVNFSKLSSI